MTDILNCGMTPAEVAVEAAEADREMVEYEAKRKAKHKADLAELTKDARYYTDPQGQAQI